SGRFRDPQRWSRRTHRLWPHVLFLIQQAQPCFPSSPKNTWRKRSSRAEQSRGIQLHSSTPAHPAFSCRREIFLPPENPSRKTALYNPSAPTTASRISGLSTPSKPMRVGHRKLL